MNERQSLKNGNIVKRCFHHQELNEDGKKEEFGKKKTGIKNNETPKYMISSSQEEEQLLQQTSSAGPGVDDANVAAIRASHLLFRVLSQCSIRLGFASLNPSPLQLQHLQGPAKGQSIPVLFSTWAAKECASFLELFELERFGSDARIKLMQIGMKVRFREKLLDNRLEEKRIEVWKRQVRQAQRDLYKQISGKALAIRTRLALLRKKLRDKSVSIAPLHGEMHELHNDIKNLQKSFAKASKVEFHLEAQLMKLVLVNRECEERLASEGANLNFTNAPLPVMSSTTASASFSPLRHVSDDHDKNSKNQGDQSGSMMTRTKSKSPNTRKSTKSPKQQRYGTSSSFGPTLRDVITVIESPIAYQKTTKNQEAVVTLYKTANLVGPSHFQTSAQVDAEVSFGTNHFTFVGHNRQSRQDASSAPRRGKSPPFQQQQQQQNSIVVNGKETATVGQRIGLQNEMRILKKL